MSPRLAFFTLMLCGGFCLLSAVIEINEASTNHTVTLILIGVLFISISGVLGLLLPSWPDPWEVTE